MSEERFFITGLIPYGRRVIDREDMWCDGMSITDMVNQMNKQDKIIKEQKEHIEYLTSLLKNSGIIYDLEDVCE